MLEHNLRLDFSVQDSITKFLNLIQEVLNALWIIAVDCFIII